MTPCPIPTDIALRYRPSRFKCFKCATTHADFFATKGSLQKPPEVVPLCFQCYVQKRRWIWRLVKENNKKTTRTLSGNNRHSSYSCIICCSHRPLCHTCE